MKPHDNFIKGKLTEKEQDEFLETSITKMLDRNFKERWSKRLTKQGVHRSSLQKKRNNTFLIIMIAALFVVLISILLISRYFSGNDRTIQMAQRFLAEQVYSNPIGEKGSQTDITASEIEAAAAFNQRTWDLAIEKYRSLYELDPENLDNLFYFGMANLYNQNYSEAESLLLQIKEQELGKDKQQELRWFLALSRILAGNNFEAKLLLDQIKQEDWHFDEAQLLLNELE